MLDCKTRDSIRVLVVMKGSALNRCMTTGFENLFWGLGEALGTRLCIDILCGGTPPSSRVFHVPSNVRYHYLGQNSLVGRHLSRARALHAARAYDLVIGWSKYIALLSRLIGG